MDGSSCTGELGPAAPGSSPRLALQLAKCFTCFDAFHVFGQFAVFILGGRSALPADAGREASLEPALLSAAHGKALRFPFSGRHRRYFGLQAVALKKPTQ